MSDKKPNGSGKPVNNSMNDADDHPRPTGDKRLLPALVQVKEAYADALKQSGQFEDADQVALQKALDDIVQAYWDDDLALEGSDVLASLDQEMTKQAAEAANKLNMNLGSSEQYATALRLWLLNEIEVVINATATVQQNLLQHAERHVATLMPGYLNFKPVDVISCSHWLLSYFWMLTRDQERLNGLIGRASLSPLGSGLLGGTPHQLDRHHLASQLTLGGINENSLDAVTDSDAVVEFLFVATLLAGHLDKLATDLLTFSNPLLGFITLDTGYTGSWLDDAVSTDTVESLHMHQGQLLGYLSGYLASLRSLPTGFSPADPIGHQVIFSAMDTLLTMLSIIDGAIDSMTIHPDHMWDALDERVLAGDLLNYLTSRGESLKSARSIVRDLYEEVASSDKPISDMDLDALQEKSSAFGPDVFALFDYSRSAAQRGVSGGTAPAALRAQIRHAMNWMVEAGFE